MLYIMVNTCIKNNSLLVGHFFGEKPNVSLYRRVLPLKLQLTLAILLVASILVLGFNLLIENRSTVAQDSRQRDASRWLHFLVQEQARQDSASAINYWQQPSSTRPRQLPSPLLRVLWLADNAALPQLEGATQPELDVINEMLRRVPPKSGVQTRISCQDQCLLLQTINRYQDHQPGRLLIVSSLNEALTRLSAQMQAPLFYVGNLPLIDDGKPDWRALAMSSVWPQLKETAIGQPLLQSLQELEHQPVRSLGELVVLLQERQLAAHSPVLIHLETTPPGDEEYLMLLLPDEPSMGLLSTTQDSYKLWLLCLMSLLLIIWFCLQVRRLLALKADLMTLDPTPSPRHIRPLFDELSDLQELSYRLNHLFDDQRQQLDKQRHLLEQRNLHDALTGLPNRDCFIFEVRRHVAALQRHPEQLALILLEVRGTRQRLVQPGEGERQLQQVAEVLRNTMRESDLLCYLQGNMFAVLLTHLQDQEQLHLIMSKLQERLEHAIRLGGYPQTLRFAAGIVYVETAGTDATELLRQAELALNEVNLQSEPYYQVFDHRLQQRSVRTQFIEQRFPLSLRNGELQLQFQPVIDISTGRWCMIEALCRWQIPLEGTILPSEFMPILDSGRQGRELSHWVIERSLNQLRQLDIAGMSGLQVAINLSGHQLLDQDLLGVLEKLTMNYHIIPGRVAIEINEQALRLDYTAGQAMLRKLHSAGFKLTLDDFGTGYSALTYLSRSPFDLIKLDGSFTQKMIDSEIDRQMVNSIIRMSHSMGKRVIGEGIETSQQASLLQEYGCDRLQGNILLAPVGECDLLSQLTPRSHNQLQQLGLTASGHKR